MAITVLARIIDFPHLSCCVLILLFATAFCRVAVWLQTNYRPSNNLTVVHTKIFQKVIGKLSMKSFYYGIFTVYFRAKVHPTVESLFTNQPDLRK